ncbi:MAG: tRNA (adenine-N(6)-)-methyltransferase [Bacteroidetes bacterium MedPE-SWsnd-G2]|nr:MAG: tRNA (adenine-N(6)-)-methyltransferase [Bacteroidetes bacterium MedPE-SWsnd-G2]
MAKQFKFKEFSVDQDRCAMKIGTDGVLLGAWSRVSHEPQSILDIGAGTGVIALMLAQRSQAEVIDGLEIDTEAYEQCVSNFEKAPWGDRLFCYHASLLEFVEEIDDQYDLIVSNPPFYTEDFKSNNEQRDTARFSDAMPFEHLMYAVANLLSDTGKFAVVIPFKEEDKLISLGQQYGLTPNSIMRVKGSPTAEIKRSFIEFSFQEEKLSESELIIETSRHQYTEDYINLVKNFYLKM